MFIGTLIPCHNLILPSKNGASYHDKVLKRLLVFAANCTREVIIISRDLKCTEMGHNATLLV